MSGHAPLISTRGTYRAEGGTNPRTGESNESWRDELISQIHIRMGTEAHLLLTRRSSTRLDEPTAP